MVRRKKTDCVAVLTADIIHSTKYVKAERQRIDRVLMKAFTEVNHVYPRALQTKSAFRRGTHAIFDSIVSGTRTNSRENNRTQPKVALTLRAVRGGSWTGSNAFAL